LEAELLLELQRLVAETVGVLLEDMSIYLYINIHVSNHLSQYITIPLYLSLPPLSADPAWSSAFRPSPLLVRADHSLSCHFLLGLEIGIGMNPAVAAVYLDSQSLVSGDGETGCG
jgi:hypothetical protein